MLRYPSDQPAKAVSAVRRVEALILYGMPDDRAFYSQATSASAADVHLSLLVSTIQKIRLLVLGRHPRGRMQSSSGNSIPIILVNGTDHSGRNTYRNRIRGNILCNNRCGANNAIISDGNPGHNICTIADVHIVAYFDRCNDIHSFPVEIIQVGQNLHTAVMGDEMHLFCNQAVVTKGDQIRLRTESGNRTIQSGPFSDIGSCFTQIVQFFFIVIFFIVIIPKLTR